MSDVRGELLSVAAAMARGTGVCERPHRNGEAHPHVHFDDHYIATARRLSDIARALPAPDERQAGLLDADRHLPDCDAPYAGEPCTCVSRAEAMTDAHPDDGHEHSWGCRRCGVDQPPRHRHPYRPEEDDGRQEWEVPRHD